jgi:benzoylformate decarboxylase
MLAEARNPLILTGDNMALSNAYSSVAALAETAGCAVMQASGRTWNFPTQHPLFLGQLGFLGGMRDSLAGFDLIVAFGTSNPFMPLFYEGGTPIPEDALFVQVDVDAWELGKNYPVTMTVLADPYWAARDVQEAYERIAKPAQRAEASKRADTIKEKVAQSRETIEQQVRAEWDSSPISPSRLVAEIRNAAPRDTAYVGAGGTSGRALFAQMIDLPQPNSFFEGNAALGFPLPGTLGVKLALPDRPVVGLLREGDSMYSIQGLWTAVKYRIPVTYVVFNNASYRILKMGMVRYIGEDERKSEFLGMNFGEPAIDISRQAAVWGMHSRKVEQPADIGPALREALDHNGPSLVDVSIDGSYRHYF